MYIYTYIAIGKDMIKYKHYILHTRIYMHDMLCNMIYIYIYIYWHDIHIYIYKSCDMITEYKVYTMIYM